MLDAHQLNVFLVAAETLNFTRTAQQLHMTQPSVSQHIQSLEKHFETDLFVRKGRHIELTDAGRLLTPLAREMVGLSYGIEDTMGSLKGVLFGRLALACTSPSAWYLLPALLRTFLDRSPQVQFACAAHELGDAQARLCDGRLDFLITEAAELDCREPERQPLYTDTLDLLVPAGHPLLDAGALTPAALLEQPLLLPDRDSVAFARLHAAFAAHDLNLNAAAASMGMDGPEATLLSIHAGLGIGFVPRLIAAQFANLALHPIAVEGLHIEAPLYLYRQASRPPTAAAEAFWAFMAESTAALA